MVTINTDVQAQFPKGVTSNKARTKSPFEATLDARVADIVGTRIQPAAQGPGKIGYSGGTCEHSCSCHSTVQHNCHAV